jgi:hypothetical protein
MIAPMNFHNRRFLTCGILAATMIASGAMSAAGASNTKITNCVKASSRPKTLTLTCGDGNTVLSGLRWTSFGGANANAKGTFETNTCEPNCAQGKTVRYPVSVKATDPRNCKAGLRVYNKLTLRFTGKKPASANNLKHWTPGCPT